MDRQWSQEGNLHIRSFPVRQQTQTWCRKLSTHGYITLDFTPSWKKLTGRLIHFDSFAHGRGSSAHSSISVQTYERKKHSEVIPAPMNTTLAPSCGGRVWSVLYKFIFVTNLLRCKTSLKAELSGNTVTWTRWSSMSVSGIMRQEMLPIRLQGGYNNRTMQELRVHTIGFEQDNYPTHHYVHFAPKNTTKIHVQEADRYGMWRPVQIYPTYTGSNFRQHCGTQQC